MTDVQRLRLTEEQAAEHLGVEPKTLANWRALKRGPRYLRYSRRAVRYDRADLEAFMATARQEPATSAGRR